MWHSSSYILILWLCFSGNDDSSSWQRWLLLMFSPHTFLMKFKDIVIFLYNVTFPIRAPIFQWLIVLKHIVTMLLHEANMGITEIFTIIWKQNKEDTVITDSLILQKCSLFFTWCNFRPKLLILLIGLSSPLCVSPRVSQLKNAYLVTLHIG